MAILQLEKREQLGTRAARKLRRRGSVPAVVYGAGMASRSFAAPEVSLRKLLRGRKGAAILDVELPGEKAIKALVQEWHTHPVSGRIQHIDFYQVRMDKPISADIALEFTGLAPAVKDLGGTLVKQMTVLPVECLPKDLASSISVDISKLVTFEDVLRVKHLILPPGIAARIGEEEMVAAVAAPRSEEELAKLSGEVKADVSAVEVLGKKKAEEEEKGEGKAEASKAAAEETANKKAEK